MKKTRFSEQQMVKILREADATPVVEVARRHGISDQTIYLWRKRFGKLVIGREHAGVMVSERDNDRTRQRGEVDHEARLVAPLHEGQQVGEHQTPLGIGVDDLDGLSRHRGHDVAGALRVAARHVLDQADDTDGVDLCLPPGECADQADQKTGRNWSPPRPPTASPPDAE